MSNDFRGAKLPDESGRHALTLTLTIPLTLSLCRPFTDTALNGVRPVGSPVEFYIFIGPEFIQFIFDGIYVTYIVYVVKM